MKKILLTVMAAVTLFAAVPATPTLALIDAAASKTEACTGINPDGTNACAGAADPSKLVKVIINILSFIVGMLAVLFLIIGGFRYITSNGDSNRTGQAKSTIIYALIGLFIVAIAQLIVNFVLTQADIASTPPPATNQSGTP
ncbi:MAG: hypothetical protein JWM37_213 [Candidatus Saccharibacteria bacterium]|nr:hypothetical protein [Candidatus Saccharibacteria bacterium]